MIYILPYWKNCVSLYSMEKNLEQRVSDLDSKTDTLLDFARAFNEALTNGFEKVNNNFEKITAHFNKIEKEITVINAKIDSLRAGTDDGLGKVEVKLDDLKTEIQNIHNVTGYKDFIKNEDFLRKSKGQA